MSESASVRCYLINLDRSVARLQSMEVEFGRLGLCFDRVSAVDGRLLSTVEIENLARDSAWPFPLTPNEIGCFLSHRRCLEQIASAEDDYAAVFEDDILIADAAETLLSRSDWIPAGTDVIKIETQGKKVLTDKAVKCGDTAYDIARLLSAHILSAGYIVSRDAAGRIASVMRSAPAPFDHFLFNPDCCLIPELRIYQLTPALCVQRQDESTLDADRRRNYRRPRIGPRIARELKRLVTRSITGCWGVWINVATPRRWGRIPFGSRRDTERPGQGRHAGAKLIRRSRPVPRP